MKIIFVFFISLVLTVSMCFLISCSTAPVDESQVSHENSVGPSEPSSDINENVSVPDKNVSQTLDDISDISENAVSYDEVSGDEVSDDISESSDDVSETPSEDVVRVELLDIPYTMTRVRVTLLDPAYGASLWQFGHTVKSQDSFVFPDFADPFIVTDEGDPSYDEWIKKYTDDWFEENQLVVFSEPNEEFVLAYFGIEYNETKDETTMFFVRGEKYDENFRWDGTYLNYIFIEFKKTDLTYDLNNDEMIFLSLYDE